jgi:DNA-binding transcriptional LysR family regulator
MPMDPRRLLTFREVARQRSFSRAGEELALTQPAVSQQVAALERQLGTALLVRGRGGALPTDAGRLLLDHADAVAARLDLADVQMAALVGGARRTLRLGAFPSALASVVPDAVAAMRAREPDLEVTVERDPLARASGDLLQRLGPREVEADFHCVTTWSVRGLVWRGVPLREVLAALHRDEASHVEILAARLGRTTAALAESLLQLELGGWVRALPGSRYVRLR